MKTTKSWKTILSPRATYFKQIDEVDSAIDNVNEQLSQVKSYYRFRIFILALWLSCAYLLVRLSWFVTWVAQEKTELHCWREVKAKNITPVFTCEKILPKTGAH